MAALKHRVRHMATTDFGAPEPPGDADPDSATPAVDDDALPDLTGLEELNNKLLKAIQYGLEEKRAVVLYGSPGTGKTFVAQKVAKFWTNDNEDHVELVQFHPGYTYEDFITGIRAKTKEDKLIYGWEDGVFKQFAEKASKANGGTHFVLIIDEINRAEPAHVLGELMYALEYRGRTVTLPSGENLQIPKNLFLICTMNTADKSIAPMDHAMRRRFAWVRMVTEMGLIKQWWQPYGIGDGVAAAVKSVNDKISDEDRMLGHSYFELKSELGPKEVEDHLRTKWQAEVEPYVDDILRNQPDELAGTRWGQIRKLIWPDANTDEAAEPEEP